MGTFGWLKDKAWWGKAIVGLLGFLISNNILTLAIVSSAAAAILAYTRGLLASDEVRTALQIFLLVLWTWIGFLYLWDRRRPRSVRAFQELSYGLTFQGFMLAYDPTDSKQTLNIGISMANYSQGPIRYTVTKFGVQIDTRAMLPLGDIKLSAQMGRGATRYSTNIPFEHAHISEFIGKKRVKGKADIEIEYGHPERSAERKLIIKADLYLSIPKLEGEQIPGSQALFVQAPSLDFNIVDERDVPL